MAVQLLIAEDQEIVRLGLAVLLKGSGVTIVGDAANGREAVDKALKLKPDVLLLDIRMSESDGMMALVQIRQRMPKLPVVMFSEYDTPSLRAPHGARGGGLCAQGSRSEDAD